MQNRSPWLHQLDKDRQHHKLTADIKTDVAIVGAGIAGIATAFFLLKYTEKKVVIIEGYKMGHGASGHNAGQVVTYFEKGFKGLIEEFGMELAAKGQDAIDKSWALLHEMYDDAQLDIFFDESVGHDGYATYEQVIETLEEAHLKREAGVVTERMAVATVAPFIFNIPHKYAGLWSAAPHAHILEMLETTNPVFLAASSVKKGCINSALFCERIAEYLSRTYPKRFALYEHAPVHKVILHKTAVLDADNHTVLAKRVVLCTNGFANIHIINKNGLEVDAKFHHLLHGRVAYMSAYLESPDKPPVANAYETKDEPTETLPYYYLTRRPYEYERGVEHNLVSIGGPEEPLEEGVYSREAEYPERAIEVIDNFVRTIYNPGQTQKPEYIFTWHGLMGYTKNKVRMVGPEPQNPVLLYNLGCNGVGILPSVFGGRKIARHIAGEEVSKSIFDIPMRVAPQKVSKQAAKKKKARAKAVM